MHRLLYLLPLVFFLGCAATNIIADAVTLIRRHWRRTIARGKPSITYLFLGRSPEFEPGDYSFAVYGVAFVAALAVLLCMPWNLPSPWDVLWLLPLSFRRSLSSKTS